MRHRTSSGFWRAYDNLPFHVRELADKNFMLLKTDATHPSLHFKKVGRFYSARVGLRYRALAVEGDDGLIWFWIGSHADYDALLRSNRHP